MKASYELYRELAKPRHVRSAWRRGGDWVDTIDKLLGVPGHVRDSYVFEKVLGVMSIVVDQRSYKLYRQAIKHKLQAEDGDEKYLGWVTDTRDVVVMYDDLVQRGNNWIQTRSERDLVVQFNTLRQGLREILTRTFQHFMDSIEKTLGKSVGNLMSDEAERRAVDDKSSDVLRQVYRTAIEDAFLGLHGMSWVERIEHLDYLLSQERVVTIVRGNYERVIVAEAKEKKQQAQEEQDRLLHNLPPNPLAI